MKRMLIIFIAILGMAAVALAGNTETLTLKRGQQKTAAKAEIIIKFVSVTEDSRCPVDANCVWAGNAKVHVKVTDRHGGMKMMVMNATMGPKGDQYNGWAIYLTSLDPPPKSSKKINQRSYTAIFTITRLQR